MADPIEQISGYGRFKKSLRPIGHLQSLRHADPPVFDRVPTVLG
jgi:hypothetical protein